MFNSQKQNTIKILNMGDRTGKNLQGKRHSIKKGQVLNPNGGKAHNQELKAIRRLTMDDLADLGSLVLAGTTDTLETILKTKDATVLHKWFASAALLAIKKGDITTLNGMLDRIVGRTPDKFQLVNGKGDDLEKKFDREATEARVRALLAVTLAKRAPSGENNE